MNAIVHDPGQDRIIRELYAWVVVDESTGLEGIFGMKLVGDTQMQAVTSNRRTAHSLRNLLPPMPPGKRIKLVRFKIDGIEEV